MIHAVIAVTAAKAHQIRKPVTLIRNGSAYTGYEEDGKFFDCAGHSVELRRSDRIISAVGTCAAMDIRLNAGDAKPRKRTGATASPRP